MDSVIYPSKDIITTKSVQITVPISDSNCDHIMTLCLRDSPYKKEREHRQPAHNLVYSKIIGMYICKHDKCRLRVKHITEQHTIYELTLCPSTVMECKLAMNIYNEQKIG